MKSKKIDRNTITQAAEGLKQLAQQQKEQDTTIADAVRSLKGDILAARKAGASWTAIAQSLQDVGISASMRYIMILASAQNRPKKTNEKPEKKQNDKKKKEQQGKVQDTTSPSWGMNKIRPDTIDL